MYVNTQWGYEVEGGDVPPLLSGADFGLMTGGRYACDGRVEAVLAAASDAVRDACGWHVAPSVRCRALLSVEGSRRARAGSRPAARSPFPRT